MPVRIRIAASGVAEFIGASPATKLTKLRPFKYRDRGEGAGRSSYYQKTINTVRLHHRSGKDPKVFRDALAELEKIADDLSLPQRDQTKAKRNLAALMAYQELYGNRDFRVRANHRLEFAVGNVVITCQPDLWVEENGTPVLIKIGVAKSKDRDYVDFLLHIIRKAVAAGRHKVRARNIAYLDVTSGEEVISTLALTYFNRRLGNACREIEELWSQVAPAPAKPPKAKA